MIIMTAKRSYDKEDRRVQGVVAFLSDNKQT